MKPTAKQYKIKEVIESLEIGQSTSKHDLITGIWGANDYFISRSFDALFSNVKKELDGRKFKTVKGFIIRTN